ncbi:hypothetical protein BD289DRAFT_483228 [Coniella lustricola]|uniref:Rhodopsin domain-containing protein n=1 Tax=Coniella lustricola TaxID=2025994 RepID=A0A2T3A688_9PEZI|nr:hypothetical protein BD289DRAFT_483228 [Coniella lustricola]
MASPAAPPGGYIDPTKAPMSHKGILLVAPITTFYVLGLGAIGLRLWARHIKKISWQLSDYFVLVAAVLGAGYLAICWIVATRGCVGYPIVEVALAQRLVIRKGYFAGWLLQCWANTFVRLSILNFMQHVFSVRRFRLALYVCEAATVAYLVGCTISWLATCRPIKYNWLLGADVLQHCGDLKLKFLLSAVFNLCLDLSILILPMPWLWTLQMNTRKKIALSVVFGLGIFVCFATAWRTYQVVQFSKPASQLNFTVTVVEDALWSGLEITLGIINACLPVMQPAVQRLVNVPFLRYITFSTNRSAKNSKLSADSNTPFNKYSPFPSWARLSSSKDRSKVGIQRDLEYSVDIESGSSHHMIPMDNMGTTTRLETQNPVTYKHRPLTKQYFAGESPP